MQLSHQELLKLLEFVQASDMDFVEIQFGDTHIVADRSGRTTAARLDAPPAVPQAANMVANTSSAQPAPQPQAPDSAPQTTHVSSSEPVAASAAVSPPGDDLVPVPAPVVGVFYRAPEPGAAPFVEVGDRVEEGQTVGLIEVMKVFNSVAAPVTGEVVELLVGNEEFVEHGQPVLKIRPEPQP